MENMCTPYTKCIHEAGCWERLEVEAVSGIPIAYSHQLFVFEEFDKKY